MRQAIYESPAVVLRRGCYLALPYGIIMEGTRHDRGMSRVRVTLVYIRTVPMDKLLRRGKKIVVLVVKFYVAFLN